MYMYNCTYTGYDRKLQKQDSLTCCAEVGRCGTTNRHCPKSLRLGRWMKKKMQKRCIRYLKVCVPKSNSGSHFKSRYLERSEAMEVKMLSMNTRYDVCNYYALYGLLRTLLLRHP